MVGTNRSRRATYPFYDPRYPPVKFTVLEEREIRARVVRFEAQQADLTLPHGNVRRHRGSLPPGFED